MRTSLEKRPIGPKNKMKNVISQAAWFLVTGSVGFAVGNFLSRLCGLSKQKVGHTSGLSRLV